MLLEILLGAALFVGLFFVARKLFSRSAAPDSVGLAPTLNGWVHEELGRMLATRLEVEPQAVTRTLTSAPDTDLVTKIEDLVQRVELVYERALDAKGQADLRLELHLESGQLDRAIKRIDWTELPADVAKEFAESGGAQLHRDWSFPWQRS
jgi:hypothetical protein